MNKKIILSHASIIYILCPAYFKTGGTELLHQYYKVLNDNGYKVYLIYPDGKNNDDINPAFLQYTKCIFKPSKIIDDKDNIIVVPETMTRFLINYKCIRKIIWWESVDNYYSYVSFHYMLEHKDEGIIQLLKNFIKVCKYKKNHINIKKLDTINYHFVQSEYAKNFLKKRKIINNIFYVSDYINESFYESTTSQKEDFVCYNPKKGMLFTKKIIKKLPNIKFVPLINMSNDEIHKTLSKSKLYIDFGNHPGKDRFPREAAISGCVIMTSKNGSANYFNDISIDDFYKIERTKANLHLIKERIIFILNNYNKCFADQKPYREIIKNEKDKFSNDVLKCFCFENGE